jgi:nucleoside-diphosphate-sugar epimerase
MPLTLVTGGSGYFGNVVVRKLTERGHPVRVFDINDSSDRPAAVEYCRGDIRNPEDIRRALEGVDVVHHNVALVPLAKAKREFWNVNYTGTKNLLDACRDMKIKKLVHVSTSAVFGVPKSNPVTEDTLPSPAEEYGAAKYEGEKLVREAARQGLDATIIRPRTILGHGRLGIFQILFDWVSLGKNIYVLGKGNNRYQFVFADDLAEACLRAGDRPGSTIYNIGTSNYCTMRETLQALVDHAATGAKVKSLPAGPAAFGMKALDILGLSPLGPYHYLMFGREMFFDTAKAQRELDWKSTLSNQEMICHSYDWYLKNRDHLAAAGPASAHRSVVKLKVLKVLKWLS